jgi:bacillithiol system protein YtxJ
MILHEIKSLEEWNKLFSDTNEQPLLVFKHSTTCPISAEGLQQFEDFLEENQNAGFLPVLVKVIELRNVSMQIAEDIGVKHESPQAILIKNKGVLWNASHWNITKKTLEQEIRRV